MVGGTGRIIVKFFASCSMKFFDTRKLIQNTAGGMWYNESNKNYCLDDGVLWFATRSVRDMKPLILGQVQHTVQIQGCHPGKSLQRLAGSVASWIK